MCSLFFRPEITFLGKFGPKTQNSPFKLQFGTYKVKFYNEANSNMLNSIMMFTFPVLDQKYPFWTNFIQKSKIVSLNWNLVTTVIVIIFWDFLMFYQIFFSPQVKRSVIITNNYGICELPHKFLNYLSRWGGLCAHTRKKKRLKILENKEILGKSQNFIELWPSAES